MGKRKHKKKRIVKNSNSSRIVLSKKLDANGDEIYDEIDKFHAEYDAKLLKIVKQPKKPIAKEVLRIISDEEFSEDEEELINYEEDNAEDNQITSNKWGKLRRHYYGTSYVDGDYGGAIHDSDEEEALQLEEQDAISRQQKLENANDCLDFNQFSRKDFQFDRSLENGYSIEKCGLAELLQIEVQQPTVAHNEFDFDEQNIRDNEDQEESTSMDLNSSNSIYDKEEKNVNDSHRERRQITYEIRKNKGIAKDKGRRKVKKHARIVNRKKFQKALIKRRSQVPDVRREIERYGGEKRGIRVSTIKSIKF